MTPRNGQTRASFLSENPEEGVEIWRQKRVKAAYILGHGDNERLHIKSTVYLSEALATKLATLPQSGPGYHKVKVTFKDGTVFAGVARGDEVEVDGDEIEELDPRDIVDVTLND